MKIKKYLSSEMILINFILSISQGKVELALSLIIYRCILIFTLLLGKD